MPGFQSEAEWVGIERSSLHYEKRPDRNAELRKRLHEVAGLAVGYHQARARLREEFAPLSRKRVHRVWKLVHVGRARVNLHLILVFAVMALTVRKFLAVDDELALLRRASIHIIPAIGVTLALAIGQLNLSFASVITLAGCSRSDFQPRLGWVPRAGVRLAGVMGGVLAIGLLEDVWTLNGVDPQEVVKGALYILVVAALAYLARRQVQDDE